MPNTALQGFQYTLSGFRGLGQPKIRAYVIWPLLINIAIFGLLFGFGMHYLWEKLAFFHIGSLPKWLQWLNSFLFALKVALIIVIATFFLGLFSILATIGANLLGAPFNGLLSEAFSKKITSTPPPSLSYSMLIMTTLKRECIKFLYYLPRLITVLILAGICYFIPVLNLLSPILLYWFSAWMMSIQYLDYAADNYQIPFRDFLARLKKEKAICLSFGLAVSLLSSIPFANFIVMPAAVLGATKLWHDKFANPHSQSPQ